LSPSATPCASAEPHSKTDTAPSPQARTKRDTMKSPCVIDQVWNETGFRTEVFLTYGTGFGVSSKRGHTREQFEYITYYL
jgi:hypothetical protein